MTELPKRIAYCAPGRESVVAMLLAYHDVEFDTVQGSPIMVGRDDIIIASHDPMIDEFDGVAGALEHLREAGEKSAEAVRNYIRHYVATTPPPPGSLRMLSGI